MRSATSSCTNSSRSAEQRWPAERNAEVTTSSATCSGSAVASTIIALMPPVSAISGTIGPSLAASVAVDRARDLGRAGEDDAGDVGMGDQRRADAAVAGDEMQRARRDAGLVQQGDGLGRDQRRLLGGLGDDAVAGHQRRGDLAQENRQRKVPGRDRDEDAAAAQASVLLSPVGPGIATLAAEQLSALRGVVAAEIGGFAHLGERVVERLAALALQQRDEVRAAALEQIGGLLQRRRARCRRRPAPGREARACRGDRRACVLRRRVGDRLEIGRLGLTSASSRSSAGALAEFDAA